MIIFWNGTFLFHFLYICSYFLLLLPPGQNLRSKQIISTSNPILSNRNFQLQTSPICFNHHFLIWECFRQFSFFLSCFQTFSTSRVNCINFGLFELLYYWLDFSELRKTTKICLFVCLSVCRFYIVWISLPAILLTSTCSVILKKKKIGSWGKKIGSICWLKKNQCQFLYGFDFWLWTHLVIGFYKPLFVLCYWVLHFALFVWRLKIRIRPTTSFEIIEEK